MYQETHGELLRKIMGITKPRLRWAYGLWSCEASKDGETTVAYGETPERAWRYWAFYRLNMAPPQPMQPSDQLREIA